MKKKFYCAETQETMILSDGNNSIDYDTIQTMSVDTLEKVLRYCNESTLKKALSNIVSNKQTRCRIIRISQCINGRLYEIIKGKYYF